MVADDRSTEVWLVRIVVVLIGILASALVFYPGCMSNDALFSWNEALKKPGAAYYDWHPPLVAFIWMLLNKLPVSVVPQYASLFIAMTALFWVGIALAGQPWIEKKVQYLIFCLCAGFFPPIFAILSQVLKDGLACSALVAAYGGLIVAESKHSRLAYAFALICLFLALGFRYNAVFAVIPLAIWAGFILCEQLFPAIQIFLDTRLKQVVAGLAITVVLGAGALSAGKTVTKTTSFPLQGIFTYDLVGMSVNANKVLLPSLFDEYDKPPLLEGFYAVKGLDIRRSPLTLANLRLLHKSDTNMEIYWYGPGKGLRFVDTAEEFSALWQAWVRAIVTEPIAYLQTRWEIFGTLLGLMPNRLWPYYCMLPSEPRPPGIFYRPLPETYLETKDSILYKGYFYLAGIILILIAITWKRKAFPRHLRYLAWSGTIYGASYFVVAPSADFRYLYWLVVVFTLLILNLALTIASPSMWRVENQPEPTGGR